ncbi:MAG: ribokinase [Clostridia bacterium]|nr:ribokinase [Clostridia bacterium]
MNKSGVCVFGSLNIDLTVRLERFHAPGETVTGRSFHTFTGGKGGNQAVAAARLGARTAMVACLGADANGDMYLRALEREGVDTGRVARVESETSGVALIEVDDAGENRIAVVPGANACLTAARARAAREAIASCACLLLQLETPLEGVIEAARIAREAGAAVILDPAPARPLPDELLALCDYLTPNETELASLTGLRADSDEEAEAACRRLIERGAGAVINKRGAKGALLVSRAGVMNAPGFPVNAVDTTAAGDTFNAGFAAGLVEGRSVEESLRLANAAAALSTTALGAQAAMPAYSEALALLNKNGELGMGNGE